MPSNCCPLFVFNIDFTPDEAQARRCLELPLRGFIARALTHLRSFNRLISAATTESTTASITLRTLRVKDARLFGFSCSLRVAAHLSTSSPLQKRLYALWKKIRRLNGDHKPHSNGHIYYRWALRSFIIAGTLDEYATTSSGGSQRAYLCLLANILKFKILS